MIKNKIQELSEVFNDTYNTPLFTRIPQSEIDSIDLKTIITNENIEHKLNCITNLFDKTNKKEFDKITKIKTKGSKKSLENILKYKLINQHDQINQIMNNIDILFLVRAYFNHRQNRNINIAFEKLEIDKENIDFEDLWFKCKYLFSDIIDNLISLFKATNNEISQKIINDKLTQELLQSFLGRNKYLLDNDYYKKYLFYLMNNKDTIDIKMAEAFNINIDTLRVDFLSFYPNFITIKYYNNKSTSISIKDIFLPYLKEYYSGVKNEK